LDVDLDLVVMVIVISAVERGHGRPSQALIAAGRVEDTLNLLAHAARKVAECAASLLSRPYEKVVRDAGIPLLLSPSVKQALDIDWNDPAARDREDPRASSHE
jgi:hypothetical protein